MKFFFVVLLLLCCWKLPAIEAARSLRTGRRLMHNGKEGKKFNGKKSVRKEGKESSKKPKKTTKKTKVDDSDGASGSKSDDSVNDDNETDDLVGTDDGTNEADDAVDVATDDYYDEGTVKFGLGGDDGVVGINAPCGCEECTLSVLSSDASGYSCGDRIDYLRSPPGGSFPELEACAAIGAEHPNVCAPCDPNFCNDSAATHCGCSSCTTDVFDSFAGAFTCGARIMYLQTPSGGSESEEDACWIVAQDYPEDCGACDPKACT